MIWDGYLRGERDVDPGCASACRVSVPWWRGAQPPRSLEPLTQCLRDAPPPIEGDVTVLWDGWRIVSRDV